MNGTRNGKVARLPAAVRQELNRRLHEGEPGKELVAWLNTLPEIQVAIAEGCGTAIREQNLSEWKQGGYRDWLLHQEAIEAAQRLHEESNDLVAKDRPPLTDTLAFWLAARYAVATRHIADTEDPSGWRQLRELCADLVELRRGDHSAARLQLERERLLLDQQRSEQRMEAKFEEWLQRPEVRQRFLKSSLTPDECAHRIREIFGIGDEAS